MFRFSGDKKERELLLELCCRRGKVRPRRKIESRIRFFLVPGFAATVIIERVEAVTRSRGVGW